MEVDAARRAVLEMQEKYEWAERERQRQKAEDENIISRFRQVSCDLSKRFSVEVREAVARSRPR